MTNHITFTLTELLSFASFLVMVISVMIGIIIKLTRLNSSIKKIKDNDLGGFVKITKFAEFEAKLSREMGQLQADVKNIKADISSLEVRFEKHLNQK